MLRTKSLIIKDSPIHGRGVFAGEDIKTGDIIEECHCVDELTVKKSSHMYKYIFVTHANEHRPSVQFMPLGFGAIYNHDNNANADYEYFYARKIFTIKAKQPIKKGDEICVYYNNDFAKNIANKRKGSLFATLKGVFFGHRRLYRAVLISITVICTVMLLKT